MGVKYPAKFPAVTTGKQFCVICMKVLLLTMVCFCRVMNQLAGVNIQSSVGMFTMSCQSLTIAESFGLLLLLHNFS